jgi:hypothetical protein
MPRKKNAVSALSEIENRINGSDRLNEEEKLEALDRARKHVAETRKKDAIEAYFEAAKKEVEREYRPKEQYEDITIDLPEYAFNIAIDGMRYYQGVTYEVPYSQARSIAEIQAAAWAHDREIHGQSRRGDLTRQHRVTNLSPSGTTVSTTGNMRI